MKLDIGCGGSGELPHHKERGNVNIDIFRPDYKIPNFVQADAHHLPFRDGVFDLVVSYDLLEHLEAPKVMLSEVFRVLKERGKTVHGTPNSLYLPRIVRSCFKGTYHPWSGISPHIVTWGKPEITNLFRLVGFKVKVTYSTYIDERKPLKYELLVKLCPFQALKHRKLMVEATK